VTRSARGGHFSKGPAGYNIGNVKKLKKKKYLQCVLAATILTVDFVVCTLAGGKKSGHVSTCRIGPFPCKICENERETYSNKGNYSEDTAISPIFVGDDGAGGFPALPAVLFPPTHSI
jgi:hypothetical protein